MLICAAGDAHGNLDRLYEDVLALEVVIGGRFEWVLQVGDLGVWPDPSRLDRAARRHGGAGDFREWLAGRRAAPRRTVFVRGNHEDFDWLDEQQGEEVLPRILYLRSGRTIDLRCGLDTLCVGGVGGCYGPSDLERRSRDLRGRARRHYTLGEIEKLCESSAAEAVDVLLTHDAPAGVRLEKCGRGGASVSAAAGLDRLVRSVRPRVCFFGHHHARIDDEVAGVPCVGLNKVGAPGNLVAIHFEPRGGGWHVVGEYPDVSRARCRP